MEFLDASSSQYNLASDIEEKHRSTEKQENPTFANISSCARVPVDLLPHLSQELLSCKHLYAFSRKEMYLRFAKPTDFGFAKPGTWASSTQAHPRLVGRPMASLKFGLAAADFDCGIL